MRAWKVQEPWKVKEKNDDGTEWEHAADGMVISGPHLLGAEDSEIIAGGMNTKGDHAAALAREANIFSWGPSGSPKYMTEEGRRVFVNTIVYMKQFDHARQTVRRGVRPRSELEGVISVVRDMRKADGLPGFLQASIDDMKRAFPDPIVAKCGEDEEKYGALYMPNMDYVYIPQGAARFSIDEDAKSLGTANNDVRSLEKWIALLKVPAQAAKAQRLLERYTGLSQAKAGDWQQWLESNRKELYFSDSYGYRFYASPASPAPPDEWTEIALQQMKMREPNRTLPVSVGATVIGYQNRHEVSTVRGALVTLVVRLKIADGWHLYARMPNGGSNSLTTINVELPSGARWQGDWQRPKTYEGEMAGVKEYRGDAVFTRQLYFTSLPPAGSFEAKVTLGGNISYQVCNQDRCLPPARVPFKTNISVYER